MRIKIKFQSILLVLVLIPIQFSCIDNSPLKDGLGSPKFASGPQLSNYYPFSDGLVKAAEESFGIFMENMATEGTLENAEKLANGEAYIGLVQEDVFRFARDEFKSQYASDPDTAEKKYIKIASQLRILMAAYKEDVFLLVNTGSFSSFADILASGTSVNINLGSTGSGTYITSKTIIEAHKDAGNFTIDPTLSYDDPEVGINKVVDGTYDAAFYVTASPNSLLASIALTAPVQLVRVYMPDDEKIYDESGIIFAEDYPFQVDSLFNNLTVKILVAAGPTFNNRSVDLFIDYVYSHTNEFEGYNHKWKDVSLNLSRDFMRDNPQLTDYKAICYIASVPEISTYYMAPDFYAGPSGDAYTDLAIELIWLMSHNLDIDLKLKESTGSRENAIRMTDGDAAMAIVQDDLFHFYTEKNMMGDSIKVASMKKIIPLHYEYLHFLSSNVSINEILDLDGATADEVNIGEKTSGTFITAINVLKSYGFDENDEITYFFDSPYDAVIKVNAGTYDAMFVTTGVPYSRFYSHDTWDITSELSNSRLYSATFFGVVPYPYEMGTLRGNGSAVYENYPYPSQVLPAASIPTVRVRAILVASPAFDDIDIATYIKSIFRKSYYMTNPPDPDLWPPPLGVGDYQPDQNWIPIRKDNAAVDTDRGIYDTITGAKEYFMNYPFGWSKESAKYYLSLFADN